MLRKTKGCYCFHAGADLPGWHRPKRQAYHPCCHPGWQQIIIKESYVQIEMYACETHMCDCSKCSSRSCQSSSGCNERNEVKQNLNVPYRKCWRQHRAGGAAILLFNERLATRTLLQQAVLIVLCS